MKKKKSATPCYLRTHRRAWGLTAKEVATLIGYKNASNVSLIENSKRTPKVEVALACEVLFGIPPSAMFPQVYTQIEDRVMWNICQLNQALETNPAPAAARKLQLFELALKRAIAEEPSLAGA